MRKPLRQQLNPIKIRRHSDIIAKTATPDFLVKGEREFTDYGAIVSKYSGKTFETKFLSLVRGCSTPLWVNHNVKKVRVFYVVNGSGELSIDSGKTLITLNPGDEFVTLAGQTYRITAHTPVLEMMVVQSAKYDSSVQELEPAIKSDKLDHNLLRERERPPAVQRTRRSKALEQLADLAASKANRQAITKGERTNPDMILRAADQGINAKPAVFGDDD